MTEMIMRGNEVPTYKNKTLRAATVKIVKLGETVRMAAFETAAIMANVDANHCYMEDGFESVHDWAMTTFGFKKSASYSLLKIGKEYTRRNTVNGKVTGYSSNLLPENSGADFNMTQVEKMLPLGHAAAAELVESGDITPDMSAKKIGQYVKDYLSEEDEPTGKGEASGEAPVEAEAVSVEDADTAGEIVPDSDKVIRVVDEQGVWYEVPESVLKQYRL
jgi:hypothetical protein